MPIYEYECTNCGRTEEVFQKISDPVLTTCRHCNGQLKKLISQSSFKLKGTGWYVTDYGGSKGSNAGYGGSKGSNAGNNACKGHKTCNAGDTSVKKPGASCASSKKEKMIPDKGGIKKS